MRAALAIGLLSFLVAGCSTPAPLKRSEIDADMFGPSSMSFHPFTQIKDLTGLDKPDGIEVLIEFQDQFGDPAKASGTFIFELYDFRRGDPDPRDKRLRYWVASILSLDEQKQRWNRISRTYTFQLRYPEVSKKSSYVLTAIFQSSGGGRQFAQAVLEGEREDKSATQPTSLPATGPATAP